MSKTVDDRATPLGDTLSVARLVRQPRLARVYTHLHDARPVTVAETTAALELPERTVYDDVETLCEAGFASGDGSRPERYEAEPIDLVVGSRDEQQTVDATLVAAVARSATDDDLATFRDRHGVDGLATALDHTREYVAGETNHRLVARAMDVSPLEASIVLQALRPLVEFNE
uniref:DUF7437 domain-containing protein n=1 Tax=uncultured prokaryote 2E01B TaxID=363283 RepID=Q2LGP4_9ZZZZ|nr:conserved hypothetical protein [uncultured prokaryote 2E01B]